MTRPPTFPIYLLSGLLIAALAAAVEPAWGQDSPEPPADGAQDAAGKPDPATAIKEKPVNTTIVIGRRKEDEIFEVPSTVESLSESFLTRRRAYRTLPEALAEVPGVLVQKTGRGQGSPYIRGFTGFRTLLLVDGIRLNHAVMRSGPNQYWGTVDPLTLDRVEIFKGPASVLYGSDAIGGTVNALTRSPAVLNSPYYRSEDGSRLYHRYSGAERSLTSRYEVHGALTKNSAVLLGLTARDFGRLQPGGDTGSLPETGYNEFDGDAKVVLYPDEDLEVVIALQSVKMNDAPRTHSTESSRSYRGTTLGTDKRRDFDQVRRLVYVQAHWDPADSSWLDRVTLSLSCQRHEETENRIREGSPDELRQGFDDTVFGSFLQAESSSRFGLLTWGAEYYRDSVDSFFQESVGVDPRPRGPVADDATYDLMGIYLQDVFDLDERTELTIGGRLNYASADAGTVDPFKDGVDDPNIVNTISENFSAAVGSLRGTYRIEDDWNLYGGVSQGFRAPNLSDLTRFDAARSGEFETPAPGLKPEKYISMELGTRISLGDLDAYAAAHHTFIDGLIVRHPLNDPSDPDEPLRNSDGEIMVTKENSSDGFVQGFELGGSWLLSERTSLFGALAWLDGETDIPGTSDAEPLSRLMPLSGLLGLRWTSEDETWWVEGTLTMVKGQNRLSERDIADTQRIPPGGTPGFTVYSIRGGKELSENLNLFLGLENISDKDYRTHGSGQNEPGLNAIIGLDCRF